MEYDFCLAEGDECSISLIKSGGSAADHQDQGDAWVRITARGRCQLGRSSYVIYVISPYGTLDWGTSTSPIENFNVFLNVSAHELKV